MLCYIQRRNIIFKSKSRREPLRPSRHVPPLYSRVTTWGSLLTMWPAWVDALSTHLPVDHLMRNMKRGRKWHFRSVLGLFLHCPVCSGSQELYGIFSNEILIPKMIPSSTNCHISNHQPLRSLSNNKHKQGNVSKKWYCKGQAGR